VLGLLGRWCGIEAERLTPAEFRDRLDLARVPREPIVYRPGLV
jgi:hypothetical protein